MFGKLLKIGIVLTFAVFGALAFAPSRFQPAAPTENSPAEAADSAKSLYVRNCARCHGADGKSETELGKTVEAPDLTAHKSSVKRNVQIITNGEGSMPGFGKKLKKADINALANYVRKL